MLRVPDPVAGLAAADRLVCHHQRADGSHEAERSEGRDHKRGRDESDQDNRSQGAPAKHPAGGPDQERHMREQVERRAATERHAGHGVERVADVVEGRLEAKANRAMPATIGRWR